MKKTIKTLLLSWMVLMLVTVSGCTSKQEKKDSPKDETKVTTTYPVKVKDQLGRDVEITKEPERIVSGYYISTSMLISLGLQDNIVGIEAKAKSRPIYKLSAPKLLDIPNVGSAKQFNLEGCADLKPDLVILPVKLKDSIKSLEDLGIKVIAVNPETTKLSEEALSLLAKATNTQKQEQKIATFIKDKTNEVKDKVKNETAQNVYFAGNSSVLSTSGKKMFQNDVIENAGAVNVAKDIEDMYWAKISYEQLLKWNPEAIIIAPMATYSVDDIKNDKNLKDLAAVKNNKVYKMPYTIEAWDSPVPSSVLGSIWLASTLYPNTYSNKEYNAVVQEFYSTFYNFQPEAIK